MMVLKIVGNHYFVDGREVPEEEFWKAAPVVDEFSEDALIGFKPLPSDALGVHPDQIPEARADAIKKGVPTDFTPTGEPIFTSRAHRKQYCERYGFYDRDGGYGDAQRGGFKGEAPDRDIKSLYGEPEVTAEPVRRKEPTAAERAAYRRLVEQRKEQHQKIIDQYRRGDRP